MPPPRKASITSFFAYTLAEVVITMLIIAVVVSISIKLTKSKLDNITSYTYYSAYSTLKNVTLEMLKDFSFDNEDYISSFHKILSNPAYASSDDCTHKHGNYCWIINKVNCMDIVNWNCNSYTGQYGITDEMCSSVKGLAYGLYKNKGIRHQAHWDDGYLRNISPFKDAEELLIMFTDGNSYGIQSMLKAPSINISELQMTMLYAGYDSESWCLPAGGYKENMYVASAKPLPTCDAEPPNPIPCGKQWNGSPDVCALEDISPWPISCPDGQEFNSSDDICGCVSIPQTIPRSGENFCRLFVSYSNTSPSLIEGGEECSGDSISDSETNFSEKIPDVILRNGMRLYNASQNPVEISMLSGNSRGKSFTKDDEIIDIDEYGYIVYIDIDGKSGNSILWEDVYPFYITLSGTVIPAYNNEGAGGNSKLHLQTSVEDEYIDNNERHVEWITKSKTFKESSCAMGYVHGTYCTTPPASGVNMQCQINTHDCRLKTIMPVKFFL